MAGIFILMENVNEGEKEIKKSEDLISRSRLVGNFSHKDKFNPSRDIFMVELDEIDDYVAYLPYLPDGYGFTGGVARGALLGLMGEKIPKIRDYDVEGIEDLDSDEEQGSELIREFMAEDTNPRVNIYESLVDHFRTRDFTINEVFLCGNTLYYSRRAAEDMDNKVIRPSEYERQELEEGDDDYEEGEDRIRISYKLVMKALLMQVEFMKMYGRGDIEDIEAWQWDFRKIPGFNIALALDKANQKGLVAEFYKRLYDVSLITSDVIPEGRTVNGMKRLANLARHMALEEGRRFSYSSDYFDMDYPEEWADEDEKKFAEWYQKGVSRAVKIKNVPQEELDY